MKSYLKVTVTFGLVMDQDPKGISKDIEDVPWPHVIYRGLTKKRMRELGIATLVSGTRSIEVIKLPDPLKEKPAKRPLKTSAAKKKR